MRALLSWSQLSSRSPVLRSSPTVVKGVLGVWYHILRSQVSAAPRIRSSVGPGSRIHPYDATILIDWMAG